MQFITRHMLILFVSLAALQLASVQARAADFPLKEGSYTLKLNGIISATLSAKELATGVNLTALGPIPQAKDASPIVAQSRAILAAVAKKEGLVSQWRDQSRRAHAKDAPPELKEQLSALTKKVEEADEKIRRAAHPQKLHFELSPQ